MAGNLGWGLGGLEGGGVEGGGRDGGGGREGVGGGGKGEGGRRGVGWGWADKPVSGITVKRACMTKRNVITPF